MHLARTCLLAVLAAAPSVRAGDEGPDPVAQYVPPVPAALAARVERYGHTRGTMFGGWIADGSGMLVSTRFGNTTQVHRIDRAGGAHEQLTFDDEPVASLAVHPRRNAFVFGRDRGGSEAYQLYWFDLDTREVSLLTDGQSRNTDPLFSHDGERLAWASTQRNGRDTDVWVLDIARGERRLVVGAGGNWRPIDFSPDGRRLLAHRRASAEGTQAVAVDLASGALQPIHDPRRRIGFDAFLYSADGRGAWFIADDPRGFRALKYRDFDGDRDLGVGRRIDWDITEFALSPDGRLIAFVANEDGYGRLHVLDAATRRELPLPNLPDGVVSAPDFDPAGTRIGFTINSPVSPSDVWVLDLVTRSVERWAAGEVGGLDKQRFVQPQRVRYPTFDHAGGKRRTIPALVYRPNDAQRGTKHAVVIDIHGGPEGQARPLFDATTQFLVVELGIAVIAPNVRGSSGYGRAWLDLDNGRRREDAVRDIGALLDWIATQPDLDAARVGVSGSSYGGYMTLASLIAYGDRTRAGIDGVGISDFVTFLANTEAYRRDQRRVEYGDERDPRTRRFLERISPLANAARIRTPLFVVHGANDPRVPLGEAEQIVRRVRANGGEVWYQQFDDEGHGLRKKSNRDRHVAASMLFWQRHLLGIGSEAE
ncbi:MAG: S9 family peptidase [Xanthomonadales bacterium]|nr:S9 family peptidase [Xanthomonadales bacterium]